MPFPGSKDERVFIAILLDGMGYDLVRKTGFLSGILESVRPIKTVLGYSCAAQPSILTGKMPQEHGGFCVYYRSKNSIFDWMRSLPSMPEGIRKNLLKKAAAVTRLLHDVTGYFNVWKIPPELLPRFQLYEKHGFYLDNPIEGIPTILDEAKENAIPSVAHYWNTADEKIFSETYENLQARQAGFHFLYVARTDQILHLNGNDLSKVESDLRIYEERIHRILQIARENYSNVDLLVFSDHGMLDITGTVNVMEPILKLPYRIGTDYLVFYDATMVRFWFENDECRREITDAMSEVEGIRLIQDTELEKLGCFFPDRRYGEAIYLTAAGKIVSPGFFGTLDQMRGMHGYHPEEPEYSAFVGSIGLDIHSAESITDLYGIMKKCLFRQICLAGDLV